LVIWSLFIGSARSYRGYSDVNYDFNEESVRTIFRKKKFNLKKFDSFRSRPTNIINENNPRKDKPLISSPTQAVREEEEEQNNSSYCHPTECSETSDSTLLANLPSITPYQHYLTARPSYFNSTIESAMKQHLDDDSEPIPFIDENVSTTHSRKSSACWSDRTSLSSRFSLIWKLNRMRSNSQNRSTLSNSKDKRRTHHRTFRYTTPSSQPNDRL
jgi:hypothetical protein